MPLACRSGVQILGVGERLQCVERGGQSFNVLDVDSATHTPASLGRPRAIAQLDTPSSSCPTRPPHALSLDWIYPRHSSLDRTRLHQPDASRIVTSRDASTSCLAHRHFAGRVYFSLTPRASPLCGTRLLQSDALCIITPRDVSTSVGRLVHRHSAGRVYVTRTPRSSPLRHAPLLHQDALCIVTPRHTSTSSGCFMRRHSTGRIYVTRPLRASSIGWSPHHHSVTPRHSFYNLINDCYSFYMLPIPQWVT